MCLSTGLKPNPILDSPQLEWEEGLHKPSNISILKNAIACSIFQVPTTTSQSTLYFAYNKSSIDAKNPSQQTFVHLQMLKQNHH
jgi:hypothetical protein